MDVDVIEYRKRASEATGETAVVFKMAEEYAQFRADYLRMRLGKVPKYPGSIEIIREVAQENPLTCRDRASKVVRAIFNNKWNIFVGLFSIATSALTVVSYTQGYLHSAVRQVKHVANARCGNTTKVYWHMCERGSENFVITPHEFVNGTREEVGLSANWWIKFLKAGLNIVDPGSVILVGGKVPRDGERQWANIEATRSKYREYYRNKRERELARKGEKVTCDCRSVVSRGF